MSEADAFPIRDKIHRKLHEAFAPAELEVIDESHRHAGHAGHVGGAHHNGQTHFRVRLRAAAFAGMSRIDRHRTVNALLADEFSAGVHALALDVKAPGE